MQIIYIFLISLLVFGVLDAIWLSGIMAKTYRKSLSSIGKFKEDGSFSPRLGAVAIVYVSIVLSFMIFVLPKAFILGGLGSFIYGAIFGILVYAIYEFTNYAGLKDWPRKLVVLDTLWGGVLFGASSVIVPFIVRLLHI